MRRRQLPKRDGIHTPKRPRQRSDLEVMRPAFHHMVRRAAEDICGEDVPFLKDLLGSKAHAHIERLISHHHGRP